MQKYIENSTFLHRIFCLVDAEHGLKETDEMLFDMIEKRKKPWVLIFTKIDKLNEKQAIDLPNKTKEINKKFILMSPIVHFTSCKTGFGIKELQANICFLMGLELLNISKLNSQC